MQIRCSVTYLPMLFVVILMSGCTGIAVGKARQEMSNRIDPLLGASQEAVLVELGAPNKTETIAGMDVWTYSKSYGMRSSAYANAYANPYAPSANAWGMNKQWESYDTARLYFKDNVLVKWDGYVQR